MIIFAVDEGDNLSEAFQNAKDQNIPIVFCDTFHAQYEMDCIATAYTKGMCADADGTDRSGTSQIGDGDHTKYRAAVDYTKYYEKLQKDLKQMLNAKQMTAVETLLKRKGLGEVVK